MWVLGLLWTGFALVIVTQISSEPKDLIGLPLLLLILLVPISLIIFSLRDRKKPD
jgi:hypothetical protein